MFEKASQSGETSLQSSLAHLAAEMEREPRSPLDIPAKELAEGLNSWLAKGEMYADRKKERFFVSGVPDETKPQEILKHAIDKRYVRAAVTDNYTLGIVDGFSYHSKRDKKMGFEIMAIPRKKTDRPIKAE